MYKWSVIPMLALFFLFSAQSSTGNTAYSYLENAELQYEAPQKENIRKAINDALTLPENSLMERRYADYSGKADMWNLRILFERHIVPDGQKSLGEEFYSEIKSPEVQRQLRRILADLD